MSYPVHDGVMLDLSLEPLYPTEITLYRVGVWCVVGGWCVCWGWGGGVGGGDGWMIYHHPSNLPTPTPPMLSGQLMVREIADVGKNFSIWKFYDSGKKTSNFEHRLPHWCLVWSVWCHDITWMTCWLNDTFEFYLLNMNVTQSTDADSSTPTMGIVR